MILSRIAPICLCAVLATAVTGCDNSGSSGSTLSPSTPTTSTDVLTGTVGTPVNGSLQSAFNPFTVGQGGGTVSVTLTSATETLPGGSLLSTVTMGLAIGNATNGTCSPIANAFTTAQAGASPQLSGTLSAGAYCVQVSDVTNQLGPVSYAVAVSHP
jgi:hypothetical protein